MAAVVALVAGVVATLVVTLPSTHGGHRQHLSSAGVDLSATSRPGKLTAADRRAIDATLDRFVPSAVARRDVAASYDLVTPAMRAGISRAEWASGDIPVFPFPAGGTRFHGWILEGSYRDDVIVDLFVQSRHPKTRGAEAFTIELKRLRGRWLVDSIQPSASFAPVGKPPKVLSQADLRPGPKNPGGSKLSATWLVVPAALLSLIVLVPAGFFLVSWRRDRRAQREYLRDLGSFGREA
jgi:hypothetical protein